MLSKRLQEIANLVDKNKTVYDVGSDHGLLPCFLVKDGICPKAYAGDNKQGPLNRAIQAINKYGLQGKVIPVLADGIEKIGSDVDIITIAGMGYYTVEHILKDRDLSKYDKLIVQVNKETNYLRQFISDNHYTIIDERVVEDGFYYEIVVFNANKHEPYNDLEIKYGPILLERKDEVFVNYLNNRKNKLKAIYKLSNEHKILESIKEIDEILGYNL